MPQLVNNGDEGAAPWTPPQLANLVGAWVTGLSGPVAKGGTWSGQYGTTRSATLVSDALVSLENGLELVTNGAYGRAGATDLGNGRGAVSVAYWYQRRGQTYAPGFPVVGPVQSASTYVGLGALSATFAPYQNGVFVGRQNVAGADAIYLTDRGLNQWHHMAGTYDGEALRMYSDGSIVGDPVAATRTLSLTAATLLIGRRDFDAMNAYMDCIYVHSTALSDDEVFALYATDPHRRVNQ